MIQLTTLDWKGINSQSKTMAKENDESTAFEDLLKQTTGDSPEEVLINIMIQPIQAFSNTQPPIENGAPALEGDILYQPQSQPIPVPDAGIVQREALIDVPPGYTQNIAGKIQLPKAVIFQQHAQHMNIQTGVEQISLANEWEMEAPPGASLNTAVKPLLSEEVLLQRGQSEKPQLVIKDASLFQQGDSSGVGQQAKAVPQQTEQKVDLPEQSWDESAIQEGAPKTVRRAESLIAARLQQTESNPLQPVDSTGDVFLTPFIKATSTEQMKSNQPFVSNPLQNKHVRAMGIHGDLNNNLHIPQAGPERSHRITPTLNTLVPDTGAIQVTQLAEVEDVSVDMNMNIQIVNEDHVGKDGTEVQPSPVVFPHEGSHSIQPSSDDSTTNGSGRNEVPVRAAHFEKDVTVALQHAIHVQDAKEGMEATFTLQPHELGKVDVKVLIKDGSVTAEFFASTHLGKDVLETNIQALRTALEHQGLQVDKIDISQQNAHFSGPFSQKGDSQPRHGQQDSKKRNGHSIYQQTEEVREYGADAGIVSQINTTA